MVYFSGASSPLDGPGVGNLMLGIRRVYAGTTPRYTRDLNRRSTKKHPQRPTENNPKSVVFHDWAVYRVSAGLYGVIRRVYASCQIDYVQGIRRYTPGIRHAIKTHTRKMPQGIFLADDRGVSAVIV